MRTVYKYALGIGVVEVMMPRHARLLHVAEQDGAVVTLWALVDTTADLVPRRFAVRMTGEPIPDAAADGHYVGTAQVRGFGAELVCHVFDHGERFPLPPTPSQEDTR